MQISKVEFNIEKIEDKGATTAYDQIFEEGKDKVIKEEILICEQGLIFIA